MSIQPGEEYFYATENVVGHALAFAGNIFEIATVGLGMLV